MSTLITTVLAALIVTGVLAIVRSNWLYLIAPRLYLNTPISDGQIVSLEIFNAGLTSQEDVAITFAPLCRFELIATSKSTVSVTNRTIALPKLSKLESVTILLLFEQKAFEPTDIESVESKSAKGKVVESKDKASAPWQGIIAIPIVLLFLALPFSFGTVIGAEMGASIFSYAGRIFESIQSSKQLAGYKVTRADWGSGIFADAKAREQIQVEIDEVVRRSGVIEVSFEIHNDSSLPVMVEGFLESTGEKDGPLSFWDARFDAIAVASGGVRKVKMEVFLPEELDVKLVKGTFLFETFNGDNLTATRMVEL